DNRGAVVLDGPAAQCVYRAPAPLPVGAGESRLRAGDAGRAHDGVGVGPSGALPGAVVRDRAAPARRVAPRTHQRAEVEHRLTPLPGATRGHERIRDRLRLSGIEPAARAGARDEATRVGVDETEVALEGEHEHRPGRVGTDAR